MYPEWHFHLATSKQVDPVAYDRWDTAERARAQGQRIVVGADGHCAVNPTHPCPRAPEPGITHIHYIAS